MASLPIGRKAIVKRPSRFYGRAFYLKEIGTGKFEIENIRREYLPGYCTTISIVAPAPRSESKIGVVL